LGTLVLVAYDRIIFAEAFNRTASKFKFRLGMLLGLLRFQNYFIQNLDTLLRGVYRITGVPKQPTV
jgi:hypothetical protein